MFDEFFRENITQVSLRKTGGKEYHKAIKMCTGYTAAQTIASLEDGPFITDREQELINENE